MEVCLAARSSGMVISEAALRGNLVGNSNLLSLVAAGCWGTAFL